MEAERAEFGRQVETALGELADEVREAVLLKIWGELSLPAAAEVAGVPPKTFEHRYYRGLEALKEKLKDA